MNRRNKNKSGANASGRATPVPKVQTPAPKAPTPAPKAPISAAKPSPTVPTPAPAPPPPAPKVTPSARLRQEWRKFETEWLLPHRTERDKRYNEIRATIIPKPSRVGWGLRAGPSSSAQTPAQTAQLAEAEMNLNGELATQARTEWERRLAADGLNEEEWTDITPEEMKAVEAAFIPPERPDHIPSGHDRYSLGGSTLAGSPINGMSGLSPHEEVGMWPHSPGGWNVHPSVLGSMSGAVHPEPPSAKAHGKSPSMNGWGSHKDAFAANAAPAESLWNMTMQGNLNGSTSTKPSTSSPLASHEPVTQPEPSYRVISPIIIEHEDGDIVEAGFAGLSEKALEESIRQFHLMAADAEIELRRKLISSNLDGTQKAGLIEEHSQSMEKRARKVIDGWKAARDADKEKKLADSKKAAMSGSRLASMAAASAKATDPRGKKAVKKGPAGKKVTIEEPVSDHDFNPPDGTLASDEFSPNAFAGWKLGERNVAAGKSSSSLWSSAGSSSPISASNSRNPFASAATANTSIKKATVTSTSSSSLKTAGLEYNSKRATVTTEEEEDARIESMAEILTRGAGSPWSWTTNDGSGSRSGTPKPETSSRGGATMNGWASWGEDIPSRGASASASGKMMDPRFDTWKPPMAGGDGGGLARDMVDLAMQNLHEATEDDPAELFSAMAMYTTAVSSMSRKRATSSAKR